MPSYNWGLHCLPEPNLSNTNDHYSNHDTPLGKHKLSYLITMLQYFRHASEISTDSSMGKKPTQQAVVQSFLRNYDKVIVSWSCMSRIIGKPVFKVSNQVQH